MAKGSLEELAGDYEAFLVGRGEAPWAEDDPRAAQFTALVLDRYTGPLSRHDYGEYVIAMRRRFSAFLESEDPLVAANAILLAIDQACRLLHRQMETIAAAFREEGGFTERPRKAPRRARNAASPCARSSPARAATPATPSGAAPATPTATERGNSRHETRDDRRAAF